MEKVGDSKLAGDVTAMPLAANNTPRLVPGMPGYTEQKAGARSLQPKNVTTTKYKECKNLHIFI